jgi:hypothetical protein
MRFNERVTEVFALLRPSMDQYRAAMASTRSQMTDYLAAHRAQTTGHEVVAATSLGTFASGRLDANKFAAAFQGIRVLSGEDSQRIARCIATLEALLEAGDDLFYCEIPAGGDFSAMLDAAIARLGRAFGAALVFKAVKTQVFRDSVHLPLLDAFPFDRWNRLERLVAPPLVVSVEGSDAEPASLARFVDGRMHLVLITRGAAPPAAFVSLISPGAFVMQTMETADVARSVDARGPAIVALVDDAAARFSHDPGAGKRLGDRLRVQFTPAESPKHSVGRLSVSQQAEQLAQLNALIAAGRAELQASSAQAMDVVGSAAAAAHARGETDAVDTLAGWLLSNAGVPDPSG